MTKEQLESEMLEMELNFMNLLSKKHEVTGNSFESYMEKKKIDERLNMVERKYGVLCNKFMNLYGDTAAKKYWDKYLDTL